MALRSVPAPFLTKTYQLVDDQSSDDVISWNEDGTTFVVWKTADFAKDLLPKYFKHNNFSSFVRQLNTYGFRKTVPDKWEFANDNFKKGQRELLSEIHRRRTAIPSTPAAGKSGAGVVSSPSNSGGDLGSTSTSSPDSKNPGSVDMVTIAQFADLSDENKKLKKDNQILNSELSQTKKQCDELIAFLTDYVKVSPDQINRIMNQGTCGSSSGEIADDDDEEGENEECLKLFGVWLKSENKKRERDEKTGSGGRRHIKLTKTVGFGAEWMSSGPANSATEE